MIFSRRGKGQGRHALGNDSLDAQQPGGDPADANRGEPTDGRAERAGAGSSVTGRSGGGRSPNGPYDVTEAPAGVQRLDLGSLQIPAMPGVEVRVQADPDGAVQQVVLSDGTSTLQLMAVAAPRTERIWDEVRDEIHGSLTSQGAGAQEITGEYGVELLARVNTPEGPADLRFVGIGGPRWMVRAIFQGAAAVDPTAAGLLAECLSGLVVDRGIEARPVKEPLPLRLPREVAEQAAAEAAAAGAGPDEAGTGGAPGPGGINGGPADGRGNRPSPRPRLR